MGGKSEGVNTSPIYLDHCNTLQGVAKKNDPLQKLLLTQSNGNKYCKNFQQQLKILWKLIVIQPS